MKYRAVPCPNRDKELVNHRLDDASPGMAGKHIRALSDGLTTKGLYLIPSVSANIHIYSSRLLRGHIFAFRR